MSTAERERIAGEQIQGSICYQLLSFTILYYDYLLTLSDERRFFWRTYSGSPSNSNPGPNSSKLSKWRWKRVIDFGGIRRNWGSSLFLMTRYLSIFGNVPVALQNFRVWNPASCNDFQTYHQAFSVVVQSLVAILLTMRVYALHQCSKKVFLGLLIAGVSVIIIGCWSFATRSGTGTDEAEVGVDVSRWIGCNPMIGIASGRRFAAAWGSLLAFDTLIFTLTLYKAIVVSRGGEVHLVKLLMRDGTMYFGVLSAANLSNILSFLLADPLLKGVSTSFANVISVTLVARLMINLKKSTRRRFLLHSSRQSHSRPQHQQHHFRNHYYWNQKSNNLTSGTEMSMGASGLGLGSVSTNWDVASRSRSGSDGWDVGYDGVGYDGYDGYDDGERGEDLGASVVYGDEDDEGLGYDLDFDDQYRDEDVGEGGGKGGVEENELELESRG